MATDRMSRPPLSPNERNVRHTRVEDEHQIEERYISGEVLGQGSFGVVREAVQKETGQKFAIKIINKEKPGSVSIMLLEREVEILKHLHHPHIIQLVEVFNSPKRMFLVLELCKGGELLALLKSKGHFTEEQTRQVMQQLIEAVVYMHDRDMVHRDLKLENILLTTADFGPEFSIKVTDFGLSNMKGIAGCDEQMMDSRCGTLFYMAPEVLKNKSEYSKLCDIWSIGVIMYTMLSGHVPFHDDKPNTLEDLICKGDLHFSNPLWLDVHESGKQLIRDMMQVDPAARVTARQVKDDPWLTGNPGKGGRIDVLKLMQDLSCSSNTEESTTTTSTDVPNGLTTIRELDDEKIANKPPHSPSNSGETSTSQSKFKPRPLAATKNNPRRSSDSSVVKKQTAVKQRPFSVSSSKIQPAKSPHYKKHT